MSNPLFEMIGRTQQNAMPDMMQRFMQFRNQFQGDPKAQVQSLLDSGRVTQEQYNNAVQMVNRFMGMFR